MKVVLPCSLHWGPHVSDAFARSPAGGCEALLVAMHNLLAPLRLP